MFGTLVGRKRLGRTAVRSEVRIICLSANNNDDNFSLIVALNPGPLDFDRVALHL